MDDNAIKKLVKEGKAHCAYDGCDNEVDEDGYCYGCQQFTCEEHSSNPTASGFGHDVADHWDESWRDKE